MKSLADVPKYFGEDSHIFANLEHPENRPENLQNQFELYARLQERAIKASIEARKIVSNEETDRIDAKHDFSYVLKKKNNARVNERFKKRKAASQKPLTTMKSPLDVDADLVALHAEITDIKSNIRSTAFLASQEVKKGSGHTSKVYPLYNEKTVLITTKGEIIATTIPQNRRIRDILLKDMISRETGIKMKDLRHKTLVDVVKSWKRALNDKKIGNEEVPAVQITLKVYCEPSQDSTDLYALQQLYAVLRGEQRNSYQKKMLVQAVLDSETYPEKAILQLSLSQLRLGLVETAKDLSSFSLSKLRQHVATMKDNFSTSEIAAKIESYTFTDEEEYMSLPMHRFLNFVQAINSSTQDQIGALVSYMAFLGFDITQESMDSEETAMNMLVPQIFYLYTTGVRKLDLYDSVQGQFPVSVAQRALVQEKLQIMSYHEAFRRLLQKISTQKVGFLLPADPVLRREHPGWKGNDATGIAHIAFMPKHNQIMNMRRQLEGMLKDQEGYADNTGKRDIISALLILNSESYNRHGYERLMEINGQLKQMLNPNKRVVGRGDAHNLLQRVTSNYGKGKPPTMKFLLQLFERTPSAMGTFLLPVKGGNATLVCEKMLLILNTISDHPDWMSSMITLGSATSAQHLLYSSEPKTERTQHRVSNIFVNQVLLVSSQPRTNLGPKPDISNDPMAMKLAMYALGLVPMEDGKFQCTTDELGTFGSQTLRARNVLLSREQVNSALIDYTLKQQDKTFKFLPILDIQDVEPGEQGHV